MTMMTESVIMVTAQTALLKESCRLQLPPSLLSADVHSCSIRW